MKTSKILIIIPFLLAMHAGFSQTINWGSLLRDQKHIVNLNLGTEYGLVFGAGYGYKLNNRIPLILNIEYSSPAGKNILDDFKAKPGINIRWIRAGNIHFSTKIQGVFRRYQNNYVRMVNWGSDMSGAIGYYKPKWFVAGEAGFDKAIITHFLHSEEALTKYPSIRDGWYQTSTGGNFRYGLQAGYSYRVYDLGLNAGKVLSQDFKTTPTVPFYVSLGINRRF